MSPRGMGHATVAVLRAVSDGHAYGFDVIDRTGLPSGTVYPALASLSRRGLVKARWEADRLARGEGRPRRRYYELTLSGKDALSQALQRLQSLGLAGPAATGGVGAGGAGGALGGGAAVGDPEPAGGQA